MRNPIRVLIAGADDATSDDLARQLTIAGCHVSGPAKSAEQALAMIEEFRPDLAVVDAVLAGSIHAADLARLISERFSVPVIHAAGPNELEDDERLRIGAACGYVLKPVLAEDLGRTVRAALLQAGWERSRSEGSSFDQILKTRSALEDIATPYGAGQEDSPSAIRATRELTERRRIEEALRRTEERLELALDAAELGLWDRNVITDEAFHSQHWGSMLGYAAEEIESQGSAWRSRIHPDDLGIVMDSLNELLAGKKHLYEVEHRLKAKSGEWRWILSRGKVVERDPDGNPVRVAGIHMDVTQRKRVQEELRSSEERFRQLAENITDVFWLTEPGHPKKVSYVSPAYQTVWGYSRRDAYGGVGKWVNTVHPEDRERVIASYNEFLAGHEDFDLEYRIVRKDGAIRWIWDRGFPIRDLHGEILRVAGLSQDITDRKLAQQKRQQLMDELKHFAYIVSHDLRAPLINVRGFSNELKMAIEIVKPAALKGMRHMNSEEKLQVYAMLDEDIPEALSFIDSSISHMDRLINAVLRLSRLGRMELRFEKIDMNDLIQNAVAGLGYQVSASSALVRFESLPEIVADRTALEQIVNNLLANAIKFRDQTRPLEITITAKSFPDETAFTMRDSGRGVDHADLSRIFQLFQRSGVQDVPGEGMGLAYVRTLVRRHGGSIWCESLPGRGSVFTFTISNSLQETRT